MYIAQTRVFFIPILCYDLEPANTSIDLICCSFASGVTFWRYFMICIIGCWINWWLMASRSRQWIIITWQYKQQCCYYLITYTVTRHSSFIISGNASIMIILVAATYLPSNYRSYVYIHHLTMASYSHTSWSQAISIIKWKSKGRTH